MLKREGRHDGSTGDEAPRSPTPVHEGGRAVGLAPDLSWVLDLEGCPISGLDPGTPPRGIPGVERPRVTVSMLDLDPVTLAPDLSWVLDLEWCLISMPDPGATPRGILGVERPG